MKYVTTVNRRLSSASCHWSTNGVPRVPTSPSWSSPWLDPRLGRVWCIWPYNALHRLVQGLSSYGSRIGCNSPLEWGWMRGMVCRWATFGPFRLRASPRSPLVYGTLEHMPLDMWNTLCNTHSQLVDRIWFPYSWLACLSWNLVDFTEHMLNRCS